MAEDPDELASELDDDGRGLLAAAATGPLEDADRAALDALLARDPAARGELEELRAVVAQLEPLRVPGSQWSEDADPQLAERLATATRAPAVPAHRAPQRGRVAWYALAACALLLVGGLGGSVLRGVVDQRSQPAVAEGPPGTLGAREEVRVQTASADVTASAAVVAHTWGTETYLDVTGLPVGQTYQVVVVDEQGTAVLAGTFIGSQKPVSCVMNAAVLRQDAARVEVLDPVGATVVSSDLPATA